MVCNSLNAGEELLNIRDIEFYFQYVTKINAYWVEDCSNLKVYQNSLVCINSFTKSTIWST